MLAGGIINCVSDLLTTVLPIPIIMKLQMPLRQRIGVCFLLCLGFIVTIAGVIRYDIALQEQHTNTLTHLQDSVHLAKLDRELGRNVVCVPIVDRSGCGDRPSSRGSLMCIQRIWNITDSLTDLCLCTSVEEPARTTYSGILVEDILLAISLALTSIATLLCQWQADSLRSYAQSALVPSHETRVRERSRAQRGGRRS